MRVAVVLVVMVAVWFYGGASAGQSPEGTPPYQVTLPLGPGPGAAGGQESKTRNSTMEAHPRRPLRAVQNIPPCPVTTQVLDTHSRSGSTVPQPPSTSADGHTYTDHGSLPSSSAAPLPRATFEQTVSCHAPLSPLLADPRQTTLSLSRCPSSQRRTSPRRPSSPSFSHSVSQSVKSGSQPCRQTLPPAKVSLQRHRHSAP